MKIKFRVSQITNLDPQVINGLIQLELKDKKYEVLETTKTNIKFYDNPWVLRWRSEQISRLDGGSFSIDTVNDHTTIILQYYLNLIQPLIGISIPVVGTLLAGAYAGTVFFIAFIIIALCIQSIVSRNVARNMLTSILDGAVINNS